MQERIQAKDVQHDLKKFILRPERVFPFDEFDGKKYAYFVKDGKKYYFKHPTRTEFNLQDDTIAAMYQDANGKFAALKSAIFQEAKEQQKHAEKQATPTDKK